ncbi:SRPBCC family protein [Micromonospora sp. NBC_00858]|uniref:SRPBCC family protein n=1 Tax=Micromonospora sp. NBC_00858 TaxID=2975979 RepID=UPI0038661A56|nr:SRPBCC family protein [Micromonospora sp. NBC_00858]
MASIRKEIIIESSADKVWNVIRDFSAGPSRMAPGFVVDTRMEAASRVVTFADGTVARERLVSIDDVARRTVYSVVGDTIRPTHDNASMQVFDQGEARSRLVWIHDVLPDDLATSLDAAMEQGMTVIKQTLESEAAHA